MLHQSLFRIFFVFFDIFIISNNSHCFDWNCLWYFSIFVFFRVFYRHVHVKRSSFQKNRAFGEFLEILWIFEACTTGKWVYVFYCVSSFKSLVSSIESIQWRSTYTRVHTVHTITMFQFFRITGSKLFPFFRIQFKLIENYTLSIWFGIKKKITTLKKELGTHKTDRERERKKLLKRTFCTEQKNWRWEDEINT